MSDAEYRGARVASVTGAAAARGRRMLAAGTCRNHGSRHLNKKLIHEAQQGWLP